MNVLHNLHAQSSGFQYFTFDLNSSKVQDSCMLVGSISHVFGPRNPTVSVPK